MGMLGRHDPTALRPEALVAVIARQAVPQATTAGSRSLVDVSRYGLNVEPREGGGTEARPGTQLQATVRSVFGTRIL